MKSMKGSTEVRNGVTLEKKKLTNMMHRIIIAEKRNQKTKELNDSEMLAKIQKVIEEEVKCL